METKDDILYMITLSMEFERFEESLTHLIKYIKLEKELNFEERKMFSTVFKKVFSNKRSCLREISNQLSEEEKCGQILYEYREKVEQEMATLATTILDLLNSHLLPNTVNIEAQILFIKMKGDLYRYLSEVSVDVYKLSQNNSLESYLKAMEISEKELIATHPLRLGLSFNFALFYYEVMNSPENACNITKKAFDSAISDIESTPDEYYKDTSIILQLLRDHLTLWSSKNSN
jgi:hypothetical protein